MAISKQVCLIDVKPGGKKYIDILIQNINGLNTFLFEAVELCFFFFFVVLLGIFNYDHIVSNSLLAQEIFPMVDMITIVQPCFNTHTHTPFMIKRESPLPFLVLVSACIKYIHFGMSCTDEGDTIKLFSQSEYRLLIIEGDRMTINSVPASGTTGLINLTVYVGTKL